MVVVRAVSVGRSRNAIPAFGDCPLRLFGSPNSLPLGVLAMRSSPRVTDSRLIRLPEVPRLIVRGASTVPRVDGVKLLDAAVLVDAVFGFGK